MPVADMPPAEGRMPGGTPSSGGDAAGDAAGGGGRACAALGEEAVTKPLGKLRDALKDERFAKRCQARLLVLAPNESAPTAL